MQGQADVDNYEERRVIRHFVTLKILTQFHVREGVLTMRKALFTMAFALLLSTSAGSLFAQGGTGQPTEWNNFMYYPYVYYPQNFQAPVQYDHLYYRYPEERRIPVMNKNWHNFYTMPRPYHKGYHFTLDVF
jgi:hypothetical protein